MQQTLGRELLPNEDVHHKDKNPLNNDIDNLEIKLRGEHQREHRIKYYDTAAICGWCGKEFLWTALQQQRFYSERRTGRHGSTSPFCSRSCAGSYSRQIQENTSPSSCLRKLDDDQIRYIREKYIPYDKEYGARALSKKFGVDYSVINLIVNGKTYKNII